MSRKYPLLLILIPVLLSGCALPPQIPTPTVTIIPTVVPTTVSPPVTVGPPPTSLALESLGRETASVRIGGDVNSPPAVGEGSLWIPLIREGKVQRVDLVTGQIIATISVGSPNPPGGAWSTNSLAVSDGYVWVTQSVDRALMKIDPATNQVVETIPIRVAPFDLAVDGDTLWVIAFDNNQVARVDTGSKQVVTTIQNVDEPTGIAVANGEVWAIEHSGRNLVRIDPGTNAIVSKTEIARWDNFKLPRPTNVVFDSGSLWVPTNFGQSVVRIDPASLVQTVIPFPGMRPQRAATGCGSIWIAVDASNEDPTESMIARIDPATNASQTWRFFGARIVTCHEGVLWVVGSNPDENGTWRLYQIEWNG